MDHCENGCPCKDFDCDLALNVTDPVYGLESIGIMEPVGEYNLLNLTFIAFLLNFENLL